MVGEGGVMKCHGKFLVNNEKVRMVQVTGSLVFE